jgi:hypothetical protein
LRGTIYQDNVPDKFVSLLPITARFGKDQIGHLTQVALGHTTTFTAKLPAPPEDVMLDPDKWMLWEKASTRRLK